MELRENKKGKGTKFRDSSKKKLSLKGCVCLGSGEWCSFRRANDIDAGSRACDRDHDGDRSAQPRNRPRNYSTRIDRGGFTRDRAGTYHPLGSPASSRCPLRVFLRVHARDQPPFINARALRTPG